MSYLDDKMKKLLKKQADLNKESGILGTKREVAHANIQKALAQAILKGSYLSQEVWELPANWVQSIQQDNFALTVTAPAKNVKARWGSILTHMKEHCYRIYLAPGISLTFGEDDGFEINASDNEQLTNFVKKHGLQIICPDVDGAVQTLNDKLDFVKRIRGS